MCVVEIAVNAKDIAATDFMTAGIRRDTEESPYRTLKVLCGVFLQKNIKSAIKIFKFSKKYGIIVQSNRNKTQKYLIMKEKNKKYVQNEGTGGSVWRLENLLT